MPKQPELERTPHAAFLCWWNEKYFHTKDGYALLYRVYEELHGLGARLDDIDMLSRLLLLGDSITFDLNGLGVRPKRKHVRTRHAFPEISDLHISEVLARGEKAEQSKRSLFKALGEVDETLHILARSFTRSPILPALLEFCLLDLFRLRRVGQRSDLWGSFFLLL